ncbi:MAG: LamG domain-containing protein [Candidatus Micrarchaeota archaeon]|nr:LamG domain-containing protein [Candidatus Micrarchaeota archaeon]MDE1824562.1 LamG domain-containing protein [Candidatus Micrarchaeota archaeon]MDE1849637.1 LamG domain-containing protein [Candidatus Micrarchaeota archaeon]
MRTKRLQSAMEYLMTYGWAILAIAIVMVSLYSLGIFSLGNLQPTATPGSCQVIRTTAQTSLAGQCNNLIPKYVGSFNGANSYISVPDAKVQRSMTTASFIGWIYTATTDASSYDMMIAKYATNQIGYNFYLSGGSLRCSLYNASGNSVDHAMAPNLHDGKWHFVACTYNGSTMTLYEDGKFLASWTGTWQQTGSWTLNPLGLGYRGYGGTLYCNCYLSNLQIYNSSLDSSSIKALYLEGIGGVPIDLQDLVAWYPLNGNANDYSGLNSNANLSGIVNTVWNANWQSGYKAPTS